jgi:hypothetical protein
MPSPIQTREPGNRTIDLGAYRTPQAIVLSGRSRGESIRQKLELNDEDAKPTPVQILVPDDILSLNSSFFLGLFDRSIQNLGVAKFEEKYHFVCTPLIQEDVDKGKKEAINTSSPLVPKR